jgi:hypothetical protein
MCILIFYTTFVWNISHSKKIWARYYHKCTRYFCEILMKLFKKCSFIKFHENTSSWSWVVIGGQLDRQTNRRDEAVVAFPNFVNKPKKCQVLNSVWNIPVGASITIVCMYVYMYVYIYIYIHSHNHIRHVWSSVLCVIANVNIYLQNIKFSPIPADRPAHCPVEPALGAVPCVY